MEAVVLAGGLGTRLRSAVNDVPKPMAPIQGRPFLERLLDYWIGQGVQRAVLAVGYMHETIRKHFGDKYRDCAITYSVEQQPLGTGGALVQALSLVQAKTFLVLNGDTYFAVPLSTLTEFHRQHRAEVSLSLFRSDNPRYTGISLAADGRVENLSGHGAANGGVFMFERSAVARLPAGVSSLEKDLLPRLLDGLYGCIFDVPFVDIGLPEDWRAAANIIT
ncbi:MAG TPA: nucleotidyltransferase family protein [Burkholderiales bacterium]|nr:nucleotidyltransferase family protein [Burkholderiales bacterium]